MQQKSFGLVFSLTKMGSFRIFEIFYCFLFLFLVRHAGVCRGDPCGRPLFKRVGSSPTPTNEIKNLSPKMGSFRIFEYFFGGHPFCARHMSTCAAFPGRCGHLPGTDIFKMGSFRI